MDSLGSGPGFDSGDLHSRWCACARVEAESPKVPPGVAIALDYLVMLRRGSRFKVVSGSEIEAIYKNDF